MSLTNLYETKALKRLLGQDSWSTTRSNLTLKVCSSIGEDAASSVATAYWGSSSSNTDLGTFKIQGDRVAATPDGQVRTVSFTSTANGNVIAIALFDGTNAVWYEEITGTARRTYANGDTLVLNKIAFGFAGNAVASGLTRSILDQLFHSSAGAYSSPYWPTMPSGTSDTTSGLYLALYDGDPGFDGTDAVEIKRLLIPHRKNSSSYNWNVNDNVASNANQIILGDTGNLFGQNARITHMALRNAQTRGSSTDYIYWRGSLLAPQNVLPNDKFIIEPGQLTIALD